MTENSFIKRWLTGIILAAIIFAIILFAPAEILAFVIMLVIFGGTWEYNNIVFGKGFIHEKIEGLILAIVIPLLFLWGNNQLIIAILAFSILIVFVVFIGTIKEPAFDIMVVAKVVFGFMYIPFLMSHLILIRAFNQGQYWVLFVLMMAFSGDTAALYVGKYFGKHKLIAQVSPGKTVEGTIGLVVTSTIVCLIFSYFLLPQVSSVHIAILAFVGSIIGQLGDLCESAIKRNYGFKDASSLLPGHGGLLDRMDCLIFIVPFVYYYKIFVIN